MYSSYSKVHHIRGASLEDLFDTESLGVNCTPKCGGCKCGRCPIGSKSYSLKEERELKLIEDGLKFENDQWIDTYPWIKDPNELKDNK